MRRFHISSGKWGSTQKCIDIILDDDKGEATIVDLTRAGNTITIKGRDWNELVRRIQLGDLGEVGR